LDEEIPGSETPDRVIDAFEELVTLSDHETDKLIGNFLVYFETTCIGIVQRTSTPISSISIYGMYTTVLSMICHVTPQKVGIMPSINALASPTPPAGDLWPRSGRRKPITNFYWGKSLLDSPSSHGRKFAKR
jgi:hypothetical protein